MWDTFLIYSSNTPAMISHVSLKTPALDEMKQLFMWLFPIPFISLMINKWRCQSFWCFVDFRVCNLVPWLKWAHMWCSSLSHLMWMDVVVGIFSVVQNVKTLGNVALCCSCWITGMAVHCRATLSLVSLSCSPKSTKWVRRFVFLSPSIISFVCPGFHRWAAALLSLLKRN